MVRTRFSLLSLAINRAFAARIRLAAGKNLLFAAQCGFRSASIAAKRTMRTATSFTHRSNRASRDHAENIAENRRFSKPEVQRVLRFSRGLKHAVASCFVDGCGHAFLATGLAPHRCTCS